MRIATQDWVPKGNDPHIPATGDLGNMAGDGGVVLFDLKAGVDQQNTPSRRGRGKRMGHLEPVAVVNPDRKWGQGALQRGMFLWMQFRKVQAVCLAQQFCRDQGGTGIGGLSVLLPGFADHAGKGMIRTEPV